MNLVMKARLGAQFSHEINLHLKSCAPSLAKRIGIGFSWEDKLKMVRCRKIKDFASVIVPFSSLLINNLQKQF